ncbi:MAG: amidase [Chloroflexi bacterium]|nr:amidase [Chloroflexota bacterium]
MGLKPTFGRVSVRGVIPLSWTLDHAGPMARTVRDVAILYATIAGYDALDPLSVDVPADDALATIESGVRGLRIGVPSGHFFERSDAEVATIVREAIRVLEREGALVQECAFPPSELLLDTQRTIISTDAAAYHADRIREASGSFGADVLARLRGGEAVTGAQYAQARHQRDELRREILRLLGRYEVLATPTTAIAAPLTEGADAVAEAARLTATTSPFNLTGLPAISVPCGFTAAGLPVGLQIAGAPWREATVLRAARAYERAADARARRPAITA